MHPNIQCWEKNALKILTIAATPFFSDRGGHMRIYNEAKYLRKLGAEVRLCTYHIGENVEGLDIARIYGPKKYRKTSPGFSWGKIWLDLKMLFLVRREIKNFQPEVIHAHLYEGLAIGYLAKKMAFRKIPIVFDLQGNIGEEFQSYNRKNTIARRIFVRAAKIAIKWADEVVVSSENVNIQGRQVHIVRDGIDLDLFLNPAELSKEEQEKIEKIKNWAGNIKILAYIGGLSDNKGVGNLLESFLRFSLKNLEWKLLMGGFGEDEDKYKKYVEEKNLQNRIYFAGRVKYFSLPHYLSLATAGIDPKSGSAESSGKLANLMAAGLPIVCFDNEFNRTRLGKKGIYMKSINDLGETLEKINLSERVDYNLEEFSEEKEARKLLEIFESLVK